MDILHIERLLYCQRHSLCALELHERSYWRATAPDTYQSFSDKTLCAYTASPHMYMYIQSLFGAQLRMTTKLMYLMSDYYTRNDGFTANNVLFYNNKVG